MQECNLFLLICKQLLFLMFWHKFLKLKTQSISVKLIWYPLFFRVTVPGRHGTLPAAAAQLPAHLSPWERFGLELILTFVVVFTYFVSMDSHRRWLGGTSLAVGSAYLAASIVSVSIYFKTFIFIKGIIDIMTQSKPKSD